MILMMNAPRRPDGPPVRDGKPYSAIAHLAEDIVPSFAIASGLRDRHVSAPEILDADLERGLMVMEDLGKERVVGGEPPAPIDERYAVKRWRLFGVAASPEAAGGAAVSRTMLRIPRYDIGAFLIEAELMLDWYLASVDAAPSPVNGKLLSLCGGRARAGRRRGANLDTARLSFAESDVAARSRRRRPDRHPGLSGYAAGPWRLRRRFTLAGRPRRCVRGTGVALLSHYVRARLPDARLTRLVHATLRNDGGAAGDQNSRHTLPGSTGGTASRNICVISPAYWATCSGRWRILSSRRFSAWYAANVPSLNGL